jgi:hypothetical protein
VPRSKQVELHELMSRHRFGVVVCHRRFGKALALDTPVPMADGSWSEMGLLRAGDYVIGTDGSPTCVLEAWDVLYGRDCYEVEFSNGEIIVADGEHQWVTTRKKDRHNYVRSGGVRFNSPRVGAARTTREIYETLRSRGEFNHRVRVASAVRYSEREYVLDPYVLGVWLGDGTSRQPAITSMDDCVIKEVDRLLPDGCRISRVENYNTGKASTYFWVDGFKDLLVSLNLVNNKHIPDNYLVGSIEQRRRLLCGLMDTDGHIGKNGACEIIQKRKVLADGIERLLFSLGMQPTISEKVINGVVYYRVCFYPNFNCFTIPRKAGRYIESRREGWGISIVDVRPVASVPVRCITVDAPDSQFLVGRRYVPTHNTVFAVMSLIYGALSDGSGNGRYAYIAPLYRQARQVAWDYFKQYLHKVPGVKFYESDLRIELPNGSRISLYGADNPDALRGIYLDGVVLDEMAQMRAGVWGEVIRPALSDRGGWGLFIGTPKGVDSFYEMYQRSLVTASWFGMVLSAEDTGVLSAEELVDAKRDMTDRQYAQEMLCEFGAGTDEVLIPQSLVMEAMRREVSDRDVSKGVRVLGVDVARYGDDSSVIFPVVGIKAYAPHVLRGLSNIELGDRLMEVIDDFEPDYVRIDAGRGEGVIDYVRSQGYRVTEVNFGAGSRSDYYANARVEMWCGMKKWLEGGGALPDIIELGNELSAPRFRFGLNNKMVLESKEQMRARGLRSTDLADALALAVGVPLRKRDFWLSGAKMVGGFPVVDSEYDEFGRV